MIAIVLGLLLQVPVQVTANTPFGVAADHDGIGVTSYRLYADGVRVQEQPAVAGVPIVFNYPGIPAGVTVVFEMTAVSPSEESPKSVPLHVTSGSTTPPPPPPPPPPGSNNPQNLRLVPLVPEEPFPAVESPSIVAPFTAATGAVELNNTLVASVTLNVIRGDIVLVAMRQTGGGGAVYFASDDVGGNYTSTVTTDGARASGFFASPRIKRDGPVIVTVRSSTRDSFNIRAAVIRANGVIVGMPMLGEIGSAGYLTPCGPSAEQFDRAGFALCHATVTGNASLTAFAEVETILTQTSQAIYRKNGTEGSPYDVQFTRTDCGACRSMANTVFFW